MRREELRKKLLLVLENWEKQHPEGTQELLLYLRGKRGRAKVDPYTIQNVQKFAKGTLAAIGEWLRERGLGGFSIHLGWTEPLQKTLKGKIKDVLTRMHNELPEPQKTTFVQFLQQISPLVEESLREFTPGEIAIAILERSLDGNPKTGSRVLAALL